MILRIYFRRRTERRPIDFDVALQSSNRDPGYAVSFAERTAADVRAALVQAGGDLRPADRPLRGCASIEYRLRIHKRTGVMFWDDAIVNCDSDSSVATCNAAVRVREILKGMAESDK